MRHADFRVGKRIFATLGRGTEVACPGPREAERITVELKRAWRAGEAADGSGTGVACLLGHAYTARPFGRAGTAGPVASSGIGRGWSRSPLGLFAGVLQDHSRLVRTLRCVQISCCLKDLARP